METENNLNKIELGFIELANKGLLAKGKIVLKLSKDGYSKQYDIFKGWCKQAGNFLYINTTKNGEALSDYIYDLENSICILDSTKVKKEVA